MEIKILSRRMIESEGHYNYHVDSKKHIVISINDDVNDYAEIPYSKYCHGILPLVFADLDKPEEGYTLFNKKLAEKILRFVIKHIVQTKGLELIIVHCAAGVSRSAGVGCALAKILNNDDFGIVKTHPCYNRLVYRTLLEVHSGCSNS